MKHYRTIIFILFVLLVIIPISCFLKDDDSPNPAETSLSSDQGNYDDLSHNEKLFRMGVDTEIDPLEINGEEVSDTYHPLSKKYITLERKDELFFMGGEYWENNSYKNSSNGILEDGSSEFSYLHKIDDPNHGIAKYPKESTSGDVDGDGYEEIVVIYYCDENGGSGHPLKLLVIDDATESFALHHATIKQSATLNKQWDGLWMKMDIDTGDFDGDGADEILVTCGPDFFMLDDQSNDYTILETQSYTPTNTDMQYVTVAAGNLDFDPLDEFIIVHGNRGGQAYYYICDSTVALKLKEGNINVDGLICEIANVTIADVDGDKRNELVFAGVLRTKCQAGLFLMQDFLDSRGSYYLMSEWVNYDPNVERPALERVDLDGDGKDEILNHFRIYQWNASEKWELYKELEGYQYDVVVVGDFVHYGNAEDPRCEEMAFQEDSVIRIEGLDSAGNYTTLKEIDVDWNIESTDTKFPTLTAANLDKDSRIVEYKAKESILTDPHVIALLVPPPTHKDIEQGAISGTTLGKENTTEVTESETFGVSIGAAVGFHYSDPFGAFQTTIKVAFEWNSDSHTIHSSALSQAFSFSTGRFEEKVVFSVFVYDVYYYSIISSYNAEEEGELISYMIPRDIRTYGYERNYYNDNNFDWPDIGDDILDYTIGDVGSYTNEAEFELYKTDSENVLYSDLMPVGVGNSGYESVTISTKQGEGHGESKSYSVTMSAEVIAAGTLLGFSAGLKWEDSYTVMNTETSLYQGVVGDIPVTDATNDPSLKYNWGLFTHLKHYNDMKILIVDYWVE